VIDLEALLDDGSAAPKDLGIVDLIVRRPAVDQREVVAAAELHEVEGLVGDTWRDRGSRSTPDGSADLEAQVTVMSSRAAARFAGGIDRWPLAGDQLYIDLDIGEENLPAGSRITVGSAVLEISIKPHTGCAKFGGRFGAEALRAVSVPEGRAQRLRGLNARVVERGTVRVGDVVRVVSRGEWPAP
jgi:hypothetical protein